MRSFSLPLPTLLAGFIAVLVGYASSAAIIWQAAASAGASASQIAGWMTALGLGMGVSTLALTLWRKVPILTAWSTPARRYWSADYRGDAEPGGRRVYLCQWLMVLCGLTGLFARLMKIIPHSLAAAMLAGILLRFGLQAFATLEDHLLLCGGMLAAWLLCKALYPRFAVVARCWSAAPSPCSPAMSPGPHQPRFCRPGIYRAAVYPFAAAQRRRAVLPGHHGLAKRPGFATMQASGYRVPVSPLIVATAGLALILSPFGVYSICIAAITAAICQSPEAHPDPQRRWLAAAAAGGFYLLAGLFGGSITSLMSALPTAWIQMLAGLALLGTLGGSLFQALNQENERDAAGVTFLVTASGVTLAGSARPSGGWRSAA
jgi:benzoate membrane transport protein